MEEVVVSECGCEGGRGIGQLARSRDGHVQDRIREIEGGVVDAACEDAGGVQRADFEIDTRFGDAGVRDGAAVPGIPLEGGGAGSRRPEIGGDVNVEGVGGGIVEGGDDEGLVNVLGGIVEDFPAA